MMSQRNSEYPRKDRDLYETPEYATLVLAPHLRGIKTAWEPACGGGKMVKPLRKLGLAVKATDIASGVDFLTTTRIPTVDAIITNPPGGSRGGMAEAFIRRALGLMESKRCRLVAMLLRIDFDSGKTRHDLFGDCPWWGMKLVLTERIVWFEPPIAGPSENHAWYIWSRRHKGSPTISYFYEEGR
jgi:hypothetical protein